MVHVARLDTASEIWSSLRAIHETKGYGSKVETEFTRVMVDLKIDQRDRLRGRGCHLLADGIARGIGYAF